MFDKVLVANRGEIALRIFRTLRELGIGSVAVYSDADRDGAARAPTPTRRYALGGLTAAESYLVVDEAARGGRAARARRRCTRATGSSPRTPAFARAVEDAGLVWIGPPPAAIELMGSKTRARQAMQAAGVPIIPGTTDPVGSAEEVVALGDEIGYPLLIKAAAGGGGKGMKVVASAGRGGAGLRVRPARGAVVLRRRVGLRRALPRGSAPRRGAGARRRPRERHPPRRARLHDPAPPPEARRGDAVARRRRPSCATGSAQIAVDAARAAGYRSAGHDRRAALSRRRLLLHGDEHAHPGRAHGHRARDRPRPDPRAGARSRPASRYRCARRTSSCAGTRSSAASTRRTRPRASCRARGGSRATASRRGPGCGSTRASRRARRSARSTTR